MFVTNLRMLLFFFLCSRDQCVCYSENRASCYIFVIKQRICTHFSNLFFGIELYMFRTGFPYIIRSLVLYTQQWVYVIFMLAGSGSILIPLASSQQNLYVIYLLLCIQYYTPDDGHKTCSKHVEFCSKNKFEKLLRLVGVVTIIDQRITRVCDLLQTVLYYVACPLLSASCVRDETAYTESCVVCCHVPLPSHPI